MSNSYLEANTKDQETLLIAADIIRKARMRIGSDDDSCFDEEEAAYWRSMERTESELREMVKRGNLRREAGCSA